MLRLSFIYHECLEYKTLYVFIFYLASKYSYYYKNLLFHKFFFLIVINIFVMILNFHANNYSHNFLDPMMYGPRQQKQ